MGFFYCMCCDKLDDDLKLNFATIRWCKTCNYRILKSDEVAVKVEDLKVFKHWIKSYGIQCNLDFSKELKIINNYLKEKKDE